LALQGTGFNLCVRAVATLRPHEQIIPRHVQTIAEELRRDEVQRDPIMIDGETGTVLDGMHRLAAFGKLGLENAVCCSVDYASRSVTLGRWARVYESAGAGELSKTVQANGLTKRTTYEEAFAYLDSRSSGLAMFTKESSFVPPRPMSLEEAFRLVESMDEVSERRGWKRRFVNEEDLDSAIHGGPGVVLLVRRLGKDDVVGAARSGRLFPCKTSMHVIDPRPVAVDFPTKELKGATTRSLLAVVGTREVTVLPPNSEYGGRRYKERLMLLDSK
jgi:hypothetical protein